MNALITTKYKHYPFRIARLQAMSGKGQKILIHRGFNPVDNSKHKHHPIRIAKSQVMSKRGENLQPTKQLAQLTHKWGRQS